MATGTVVAGGARSGFHFDLWLCVRVQQVSPFVAFSHFAHHWPARFPCTLQSYRSTSLGSINIFWFLLRFRACYPNMSLFPPPGHESKTRTITTVMLDATTVAKIYPERHHKTSEPTKMGNEIFSRLQRMMDTLLLS